jgi:hypothetical protein
MPVAASNVRSQVDGYRAALQAMRDAPPSDTSRVDHLVSAFETELRAQKQMEVITELRCV